MRHLLAAFGTGSLQVFLVAYQTRQFVHRTATWRIVGIGFLISAVWVFNIRAAVSGLDAGAAYALGAAFGTWLALRLKMKAA